MCLNVYLLVGFSTSYKFGLVGCIVALNVYINLVVVVFQCHDISESRKVIPNFNDVPLI